jgi:hypothetical protein
MKQYQKEKADMKRDKPKLYVHILKLEGWTEIEENVDPECLWKLVEGKHRVHPASEVALVVKLEARTQLQNIWQIGFQCIISYKQHYMNTLKAHHDQGGPHQS